MGIWVSNDLVMGIKYGRMSFWDLIVPMGNEDGMGLVCGIQIVMGLYGLII